MKTAVFGGTFDPVHNAHTDLAREIVNRRLADKILFIPAFHPPHKDVRVLTDYALRRDMLNLAIADEPLFELSEIEYERKGRSYTFETLRELSARRKYESLELLIGSDSLRQLHSWYKAKELVRDYRILVYPRKGETPDKNELRNHWSSEECEKLMSGFLPELPVHDCSSTEVRRLISEAPGKAEKLLNARVAAFIYEHGLYQH